MLVDDVRVPLANVAHYDTGEGFGRRLPRSLDYPPKPRIRIRRKAASLG